MSKFNSLQEMVDTISTHLFTQGHQAFDTVDMYCVYRNAKDGSSCAVGCLISDEEYSFDMEGLCAADVLLRHRGVIQVVDMDSEHLFTVLERFQSVHDDDNSWVSADTLRNALANVYDNYDLSTTLLSTLNFSKDH